MGAGDGNVRSNVSVRAVVVAQMGGWGAKGRGWDVSSNVSVGAVIVAQMGGVGHKGLQSRWHDIR